MQAAAVVPLIGAAIFVGVAPSAVASGGTSAKTNGCYSTWGNTGSNSHCTPATVTGNYRNHLACNSQADKVSGWLYITKNSTVSGFGQLNCTFKASSARVEFTG